MTMRYFRSRCLACAVFIGLASIPTGADATVEIERDIYGVPKITADNTNQMWFAFGFAQGRDRLIQLEIMRQEAYGSLPTTGFPGAGKRQVRNWKRRHLFPDLKTKLDGELDGLNDGGRMRLTLHCFTAGIQAFKDLAFDRVYGGSKACNIEQLDIDKITSTEFRHFMDQERSFLKNIFRQQGLDKESKWEALDSLALFHLRVMHEFSLRNTEMKNLKLLHDLYQVRSEKPGEQAFVEAAKVFNSVKWALHPNAKTTIPKEKRDKNGWVKNATDKAIEYHQKLVTQGIKKDRDNLVINGCTLYNPQNMGGLLEQSIKLASHNVASPFPMNASNWWVISQPRPEDAPGGTPNHPNSLLYNGPQIPAIDPSHTYQVSLASGEDGNEFQFAGNAYIGSPNFWQGHNGTMAFGLTAGNIDVSDVFCVDVTKKGEQWGYGARDNRRSFEPILEGDQLEDFRSVARHAKKTFGTILENIYQVADSGWPVLAIDPAVDGKNGTAYIMRYNWQGLTASSLHHWLNATQAKTHPEWNEHLDHVAGNFNLSAAHQDGTIGYRLIGALPVKAGMNLKSEGPKKWNYFPSYDPRLPAPMTPEEGWPERGPVANFHKLQMTQTNGFIANWNQKPFINMPDGDLDYDAYTPYDRVFLIERMLGNRTDPWSHRDILEMNGRLQRMDVNYIIFLPFLKELNKVAGLNDLNKQALKIMLGWDGKRGDYRKGDARGLHKGHVLFYYWLEELGGIFKKSIALHNPALVKNLGSGQFKLKQPKLSWDHEDNIRNKHTIETSHNTHLGSRIMLQALHAALGQNFSNDHGFEPYTYDEFQTPLLKNSDDAFAVLKSAVNFAITSAAEKGWEISYAPDEDPYFPAGSATFSGLSNTLAGNDTQVGFRPGDPLSVRHFRNRGALNLAAALWSRAIHGANISSPGIREYRGYSEPVTEEERRNDWTINQLYMFRDNEYRPMHSFTPLSGIQDIGELNPENRGDEMIMDTEMNTDDEKSDDEER